MNLTEQLLNTIDQLRTEKRFDEAIEALNVLRNMLNIEDNKFHILIDNLIENCESEKRECLIQLSEPSPYYLQRMRELQRTYEDGEINLNHKRTIEQLIKFMNDFEDWKIDSYDEDVKGFINHLFNIANIDGLRFAMLRVDSEKNEMGRKSILHLYELQNNSTPGNIIMSKSNLSKPVARLNTKKRSMAYFK
jgi:hypothetical protein